MSSVYTPNTVTPITMTTLILSHNTNNNNKRKKSSGIGIGTYVCIGLELKNSESVHLYFELLDDSLYLLYYTHKSCCPKKKQKTNKQASNHDCHHE